VLDSGNTSVLSVLGQDDHGEGALIYTWSVSALPNGAPVPKFSANVSNAAKTTTVSFYQSGEYQFTVTIRDAGGLTTTSTVSVTVNTIFPAVIASDFDFHNHLTFKFNEDVSASLDIGDLVVQALPAGSGQAIEPLSVSWDPASNTATFTFASDFVDGNYRATIAAGGVVDAANLQPSFDWNYDFWVLPGDLNHDRFVDFNDLAVLAQNYNQSGLTYTDGDLNGDGTVDFNDLVLLAQRYNTSLPALAPPLPSAAQAVAAPPSIFSTSKIAIVRDHPIDGLPKARRPAPPKRHK
jgi:hypothetical protein